MKDNMEYYNNENEVENMTACDEEIGDTEIDLSVQELENESAMIPGSKKMLLTYLREIGGFRPLTKAEEAMAWARRSRVDIENIVDSHLKMVVAIANKISPYSKTAEGNFMDLVQAGNMGLMKATNSFDSNRGVKFSTYAFHWISSYIRSEAANQRSGIKKPAYVLAAFNVIAKIEDRLEAILKHNPTQAELEVALDGIFTEERLAALLSERTSKVLSLDAVYDDPSLSSDGDSGASLSNCVPDSGFDEKIEQMETADAVMAGIKSSLDPKLQVLICARFGLGEFRENPRTLGEVADILEERGLTNKKLTQERIRQLEKEALGALRENPELLKLFRGC